MARPIPTTKQAVKLDAGGVRVSRIRRDPPPKVAVKQLTIRERNERDTKIVVIGVVTFALAIAVAIVGLSGNWGAWSPRQYVIHI